MSNPSITADKTPWYQWDTGLTVTVSGGEMDECHFANRKQGTAYVQAVINGVARVPDELLQVAAPIKSYGYVSDGAGGQTYVEQTFEVIARNIPSDYTYTKTAQKTILDAETARDQAVQAAKDAKASELAADDSAVEASNSAQSAGESASAAATSASNAAKSAGEAAKSASDAKAAADKAVEDASELLKTYTDNAKMSADNAATSASNAADAASAASGSASAAEQSATDASNAKAAAQTAKAGAETAASNAATSASNAESSATAAANSASDAAASVGETLNEAKKYTDANTSNALVGTVTGKLLHVEDAWPSKPLGLTIDGTYKQDGTPSPESPAPIEVVENPVVKVKGRNLANPAEAYYLSLSGNPKAEQIANGFKFTVKDDYSRLLGIPCEVNKGDVIVVNFNKKTISGRDKIDIYFPTLDEYFVVGKPHVMGGDTHIIGLYIDNGLSGEYEITNFRVSLNNDDGYAPYTSATLQITLPAEHPYLAALPDGTHDEIVIDKDGNASLVARVQKADVSNLPAPSASDALDNGLTRYQYWSVIDPPARNDTAVLAPAFKSVVDFAFPQQGMYASNVSIIVGASADPTDALKAGGYIYTTLATPVTYNLGKLDIPSLPEAISNVWTDAELTTNMSMTYKRDINIAFNNLAQAVVAASAGE